MFCGTDNIPQNISKYFVMQTECGKKLKLFCKIMSVPHNIVIDMNNTMSSYLGDS